MSLILYMYTKFKLKVFLFLRKILHVFIIYGPGSRLGQQSATIWTNFYSSSGFREGHLKRLTVAQW